MKNKASKFEDVYEGFEDAYFRKSLTLHRLAGLERLSFSESQVVGALISFKHGDRDPFPSVATLAHACGIGERAVNTALKRLRERGWIASKQRAPNESNVYDLSPLFDRLKKVKVEPPAATATPKAAPEPAPLEAVEAPQAQVELPQAEEPPKAESEDLDAQQAEIEARLEEIRKTKPRQEPKGWNPLRWQLAHNLTLPSRMVFQKDDSGKYVWSTAQLEALVTALAANSEWKVSPNANQETQAEAIRKLIAGIVPEPAEESSGSLVELQKHYEALEPASFFSAKVQGRDTNLRIANDAWLAFVGNGGLEMPRPAFKTKLEAMNWITGVAYRKDAAPKSAPPKTEPEFDPDSFLADYKTRAA